MDKKITDIDQEIEKKIIDDRQKDYGNYQENFVMLAEMFTRLKNESCLTIGPI